VRGGGGGGEERRREEEGGGVRRRLEEEGGRRRGGAEGWNLGLLVGGVDEKDTPEVSRRLVGGFGLEFEGLGFRVQALKFIVEG
jgi:hypothetical protein